MVIRPTDRVAAVLARYEHLIEVFTSLAPTFEKLRNPAMRKVMARLVTVEQAARVAGIDPSLLLERLNAALAGGDAEVEAPGTASSADTELPGFQTTPGDAVSPGTPGSSDPLHSARDSIPSADIDTPDVQAAGPGAQHSAALPAILAAVPEESIVDIDVRPDLRRGEEPFSKIMAVRRKVPPGGVLRLRATFEPVPLYAVLGKQGFEHWTECFAADDWRVWFYTAPAEPEVPAAPGITPTAESGQTSNQATHNADSEDDVVVLDVRGLEPPEPMLRTFEALERLPRGKALVQLNVRVPRFLLPQLAERGFTYEIREQGNDLVRIFVRHMADDE